MADETGGQATAGALLRAAREAQGLHIAALAAAIKVAPRKLDALENDRWHELPDAAFTRALALTVCRTLKVDAGPVLERLPAVELAALEAVSGHLNAPFHDRPGRGDGSLAGAAVRPMVWAAAVLMAAALAVYFVPRDWWSSPASAVATAPAPAPAASALPPAAAASAAASAPVLAGAPAAAEPAASQSLGETVFSAPPPQLAVGEPAAGLVQLRASESSWVDARDGRGQVLLSRIVQPGESVGLDGTLPIRLTIGNAAATRLGFRGQPVDLLTSTRDNVARIELQ